MLQDGKQDFIGSHIRPEYLIIKVGFDYKTKTVFVHEPYDVRGNMNEEMEKFKNYFKQFIGKNLENGVK